jgi:CubicO group peptidase (beta-lactamase class C family)
MLNARNSQWLILLAVLVVIGKAWAKEPPKRTVDALFSDLTKPGSPGCAVGIYRGGRIIYAKGYGLANVEESVPITPETVFDVGSIAKQFTAASILLLERQGKLHLDDDVRNYIPELPDYSARGGERMTILHLLNHTSGLRDYVSLFSLSGIHPDNVTTDQDALGIIMRQKRLNFQPGSDWQYSNSGYFLLSLVVKRISGKTLKDFAAENIFHPLGMMHTQYRNDHTSLIPHRALAYDPGENAGFRLSVPYAEENGDGMVQTSIEDLQKWDENFYSGAVGGNDFALKMEQQARLADGTMVAYAKGVYIGEYRGLRTVWHSGGSGGYHAYFVQFPERHFSVACLCNRGGINREKLVQEVADLYLDDVLKRKNDIPASSLTPGNLQTLAGTYRDPKRGDIWRISVVSGKLWAELEGTLVELRQLSPTEFEHADYPLGGLLRFEPARDSLPRKLLIEETGDLLPITAEVVLEAKPSAGELKAYAGCYWSDELRVTYCLKAKDGKLWMSKLLGADGIVHEGTVPFDELRPVISDEFDLKGAPIVFDFMRDASKDVTGFTLNGLHERGILFTRSEITQ